jgi:hypothetical protein
MSNWTNWHDAKGRGTCGIYQIKDELSGRVYIGQSTNCEYRLGQHRQRLDRGSRRLPQGLKNLAYPDRAVRLTYTIIIRCRREELDRFEFQAMCGKDCTNIHHGVAARNMSRRAS